MLLIHYVLLAPTISFFIHLDLEDKLINNWKQEKYNVEFNRFIDYLGYKESRNDWTAINSINCFGEWQFSYPTLKHMGYGHITPDKFRINPLVFPRELQLKVLKEFIKANEIALFKYQGYFGTYINDILITKAGLLAAMHLGGLGSMHLFVTSNGIVDKQDMNGTKISDYIREFNSYNL
jgi:hypothetical protein